MEYLKVNQVLRKAFNNSSEISAEIKFGYSCWAQHYSPTSHD